MPKHNDTPSPYLSTRELAERWSVSVKAVRELVHRGELPYSKLGYHTWRFRLADVERFEKRHTFNDGDLS